MSKPQQPEIRRSERGDVDQGGQHQSEIGKDQKVVKGNTGKVPPENRPGHHPEKEQDKPI